jgi:hypothetical protein
MKFNLIAPVYKSSENLKHLCNSIVEQSYEDWNLIISVDACNQSWENALSLKESLGSDISKKVEVKFNPQRKFALGNIFDCVKEFDDQSQKIIFGVIDGDDELCNSETLSMIAEEYQNGSNLVWTTYCRDDEGECVSDTLPSDVDPYRYRWVSSHFRTFGSWIFKNINNQNFKGPEGDFFKRAYDQALMLPMLYYCNINKLKTSFVPEVCYRYNHKNSSTPKSEHTNGIFEHQLAEFIRGRGYIE